jgi:hypothetical protein
MLKGGALQAAIGEASGWICRVQVEIRSLQAGIVKFEFCMHMQKPCQSREITFPAVHFSVTSIYQCN